MKKIITALIISLTVCYPLAATDPIPQLKWEDLIPQNLKTNGLLANLDKDQRDMVYWVIHTLENLPPRSPETQKDYEEVDSVIPMLKEANIDLKKVMAKRNEIRTAVAEHLNGKTVRIPGYLLPLETSGKKVTEFLLVPYIGACIHVPPPPTNQIVHVALAPKKGYRNKKIFEPVLVTGKLSVKSQVKKLYLSDGSANIPVGYTLQATRVVTYKE